MVLQFVAMMVRKTIEIVKYYCSLEYFSLDVVKFKSQCWILKAGIYCTKFFNDSDKLITNKTFKHSTKSFDYITDNLEEMFEKRFCTTFCLAFKGSKKGWIICLLDGILQTLVVVSSIDGTP